MSEGLSVCQGTTRFSLSDKEEPYKDRLGNWRQRWPHYVKGNEQNNCGQTFRRNQGRKMGRREGKKNAGSQRQGGVDAKEKRERSRGGDAQRHPLSAASEVPANRTGASESSTPEKNHHLWSNVLQRRGNRHHLDLMRGEQLRRL